MQKNNPLTHPLDLVHVVRRVKNRRGLAGPVRPEHPDDLAALDSKADVIDGAKVPEYLAQIFYFYQHRTTCL
jgi:hypothetical protein